MNGKQQLKTYRVYVVTWNVAGQFPDDISLRNLLDLPTTPDEQNLPDIYAIGLEEVNANPQQQVLDLFKEDPWIHKAKNTLREFGYIFVKSEQMQGLLLSVYVRRKHAPYLQDIEAQFTRTGFGGMWGNKGAVSVRFSLYGCAFAFVAAHLAAHDQYLEERVEDYKQILENHHYSVPRFHEIFDHDYVFWFGDLNFRLQGEDSAAEVLEAVNEKKFETLLQRDQLRHVRLNTQEAFQLLNEGIPAFAPTFKFKQGTHEYNLKRRPAWTDRILYAVQPSRKQPDTPLAIEQFSYKSHPIYSISDHKPVTSQFTVKLYPDFRKPCVKFRDIPVWVIGEKYTVEYTKPHDFQELDFDWIGIYNVGFSGFNEHIEYEYVNYEISATPTHAPTEINLEAAKSTRRQEHQGLRREQQEGAETVHVDFDADIDLSHGLHYMLIYFQNTSLGGVTSVAGLSNVFVAKKASRRHSRKD